MQKTEAVLLAQPPALREDFFQNHPWGLLGFFTNHPVLALLFWAEVAVEWHHHHLWVVLTFCQVVIPLELLPELRERSIGVHDAMARILWHFWKGVILKVKIYGNTQAKVGRVVGNERVLALDLGQLFNTQAVEAKIYNAYDVNFCSYRHQNS
jgi:hypothetical protein